MAFKACPDLPDTLQLNQLTADCQGRPGQAAISCWARLPLPAEKGPVDLLLQGRVDAKGAQLAGLDLSANPTSKA
jgi:translocation and assembly module TamB